MNKKVLGFYRKCDILTMFSIVVSLIGVMLLINEHYTVSTLCLLISGICDGFDGRLARSKKYPKEAQVYGVQLDSLADVICFGVFPSVITLMISPFFITKVVALFYTLCGVVRLAYFNMLDVTGKAIKGYYRGVPITTIAFVYFPIFLLLRIINVELAKYVMPVILLIMGLLFIINIKVKKVNVDKIIKIINNKYLVNYIYIPFFFILSGNLFFRAHFDDFFITELLCIKDNIIAFIVLFVFVDGIMLLLDSIFNNSKITKTVLFLLLLILMVVNDVKFQIMSIPIELSDVNYLNPANISMMGTATTTIGSWIYKTIIKGIILFAFILLIFFLDKYHKIKFDKLKNRLIALIGSLIVILSIVFGLYRTDFVYKIYRTDYEEMLTYGSIESIYKRFGFFEGLIINGVISNDKVPEGYNEVEINKLLISYSKQEDGSWGKANVVFILSESFSDVEALENIKFKNSLTPNIDKYSQSKNAMVFDLLVPTYGGGSVNTEFEVLTSAAIHFFKAGYIPYNSYYDKYNLEITPHLIKEFNNNGYETMYLTPWSESSFNSKTVYSGVGTKTLKYDISNGDNKGYYYSDEAFMNDIYEELKDTSKGNYKFIMAATAENHYPFSLDKFDKYDVEITNTYLNKEDSGKILAYAQGIYDADKTLGQLYEKIKKLDTPTIIVFFGDHLPFMSNDAGENIYFSNSYFNHEDQNVIDYRMFTTKAVILANYDIETEDLEQINSSFLGSYVINKMDLKVSNYFKAIDDIRKVIPSFNRNCIYKNGKYISLNDLSDDEFKAYMNYKYIQYRMFYDY